MVAEPFVYGLQPRWFGNDRLFKVFVLPDAVCGACVAGQLHDEQSAHMQLVAPAGCLGFLFLPIVRRAVRRRQEREEFYDTITPGSDEFVDADGRNFVIRRGEATQISVTSRQSLWTAGARNSGKLEIVLTGGRKRRFVLVGNQDADQVEELLSRSLGVETW